MSVGLLRLSSVAALFALLVASSHAQAPAVAPAPPSTTSQPAAAGDGGIPVPAEFLRKVREAVMLDYELQKAYTYVEKRRDVKLTGIGKVTVGPERTFEVYPSPEPGKTYKRLVAIDGKPLDAAELARRDDAHRQNMISRVEQQKTETPGQRNERLKKDREDRREREALMDDAFAIFEPKVAGREIIDGRQVLVATLTPRARVQPKTREGKWMKKFAGRIWVSESDYQMARIEMTALDTISIGWGFVGRVHEGSKLTFVRRKVNDEVWLPAETRLQATGRTLLFRSFKFDTMTTYSDYRKWSVDTNVNYGVPPSF